MANPMESKGFAPRFFQKVSDTVSDTYLIPVLILALALPSPAFAPGGVNGAASDSGSHALRGVSPKDTEGDPKGTLAGLEESLKEDRNPSGGGTLSRRDFLRLAGGVIGAAGATAVAATQIPAALPIGTSENSFLVLPTISDESLPSPALDYALHGPYATRLRFLTRELIPTPNARTFSARFRGEVLLRSTQRQLDREWVLNAKGKPILKRISPPRLVYDKEYDEVTGSSKTVYARGTAVIFLKLTPFSIEFGEIDLRSNPHGYTQLFGHHPVGLDLVIEGVEGIGEINVGAGHEMVEVERNEDHYQIDLRRFEKGNDVIIPIRLSFHTLDENEKIRSFSFTVVPSIMRLESRPPDARSIGSLALAAAGGAAAGALLANAATDRSASSPAAPSSADSAGLEEGEKPQAPRRATLADLVKVRSQLGELEDKFTQTPAQMTTQDVDRLVGLAGNRLSDPESPHRKLIASISEFSAVPAEVKSYASEKLSAAGLEEDPDVTRAYEAIGRLRQAVNDKKLQGYNSIVQILEVFQQLQAAIDAGRQGSLKPPPERASLREFPKQHGDRRLKDFIDLVRGQRSGDKAWPTWTGSFVVELRDLWREDQGAASALWDILWDDYLLLDLGLDDVGHLNELTGFRQARAKALDRLAVAGDASLDQTAVQEVLGGREQEINAYLHGTLTSTARQQFVEELRNNHALRVAVIEHREAQLRSGKERLPWLTSELARQLAEGVYAFDNLLYNSPGSSQISGIEFREDIVSRREKAYWEARMWFERALRLEGAEDIALENLWCLRGSWNRLQQIQPSSYPQGDLRGVMTAVSQHLSGSYRTAPPNLWTPVPDPRHEWVVQTRAKELRESIPDIVGADILNAMAGKGTTATRRRFQKIKHILGQYIPESLTDWPRIDELKRHAEDLAAYLDDHPAAGLEEGEKPQAPRRATLADLVKVRSQLGELEDKFAQTPAQMTTQDVDRLVGLAGNRLSNPESPHRKLIANISQSSAVPAEIKSYASEKLSAAGLEEGAEQIVEGLVAFYEQALEQRELSPNTSLIIGSNGSISFKSDVLGEYLGQFSPQEAGQPSLAPLLEILKKSNLKVFMIQIGALQKPLRPSLIRLFSDPTWPELQSDGPKDRFYDDVTVRVFVSQEQRNRTTALIRTHVSSLTTVSDPAGLEEDEKVEGVGEEKIGKWLRGLDDEDPNVRRAAAYRLGELSYGAAASSLRTKLNDSAPGVRQAAAWALSQIPSSAKGAVRMLIARLDDPVPGVRRAVAQALGAIGSAEAVPALEERLLGDSDDSVLRATTTALQQIRSTAGLEEQVPKSLPGLLELVERYVRQGGTIRTQPIGWDDDTAEYIRLAAKIYLTIPRTDEYGVTTFYDYQVTIAPPEAGSKVSVEVTPRTRWESYSAEEKEYLPKDESDQKAFNELWKIANAAGLEEGEKPQAPRRATLADLVKVRSQLGELEDKFTQTPAQMTTQDVDRLVGLAGNRLSDPESPHRKLISSISEFSAVPAEVKSYASEKLSAAGLEEQSRILVQEGAAVNAGDWLLPVDKDSDDFTGYQVVYDGVVSGNRSTVPVRDLRGIRPVGVARNVWSRELLGYRVSRSPSTRDVRVPVVGVLAPAEDEFLPEALRYLEAGDHLYPPHHADEQFSGYEVAQPTVFSPHESYLWVRQINRHGVMVGMPIPLPASRVIGRFYRDRAVGLEEGTASELTLREFVEALHASENYIGSTAEIIRTDETDENRIPTINGIVDFIKRFMGPDVLSDINRSLLVDHALWRLFKDDDIRSLAQESVEQLAQRNAAPLAQIIFVTVLGRFSGSDPDIVPFLSDVAEGRIVGVPDPARKKAREAIDRERTLKEPPTQNEDLELVQSFAGLEEGRSVLYPPEGKKAEMLFGKVDPSDIADYIAQVALLARQITVTISPWAYVDEEGQRILQGAATAHGIPLTIVQLELSQQFPTYAQFVYELDARVEQPLRQRQEQPLKWTHPEITPPFKGRVLFSDFAEVEGLSEKDHDRLAAKAIMSATHLTALDPIPVVQLAVNHPDLINFLAEVIEEYGAIGNHGALEPLRALKVVLEESELLASKQHIGADVALAHIRRLQEVLSASIAQLDAAAGLEEGMTRRDFLKTLGVVAGTEATGAALGVGLADLVMSTGYPPPSVQEKRDARILGAGAGMIGAAATGALLADSFVKQPTQDAHKTSTSSNSANDGLEEVVATAEGVDAKTGLEKLNQFVANETVRGVIQLLSIDEDLDGSRITDLTDYFDDLRAMVQEAGYPEGLAQLIPIDLIWESASLENRVSVFVQVDNPDWKRTVAQNLEGAVSFVDSIEDAGLVIVDQPVEVSPRQAILQVNEATYTHVTPALLRHLEKEGLLKSGSVVSLHSLVKGDLGEGLLLFA